MAWRAVWRSFEGKHPTRLLILAHDLAKSFLDELTGQNVRFYSNTIPSGQPGPAEAGALFSWRPATTAPFDTGVLVVGSQRCGCLWVEDED